MDLGEFYALILFAVSVKGFVRSDANDESVLNDSRLDFIHLVGKYGYPAEAHEITTSDGYILKLHRIPYGRECREKEKAKLPVLLMHGLLSSSISWVVTGPEKSLGYILADNCYDVWLGNNRGNYESRRHKTLDPKYPVFWNFSWHEMGIYDLPAFIRYILDATGQSSLHYIGHSQGTTEFFVFNSFYPEMSDRIRSCQALAPVAYIRHLKSPIARFITSLFKHSNGLTNTFIPKEFLPWNELVSEFGRQICRDRYPLTQLLCSNLIFAISGFDPMQLNNTLLPIIVGHSPAGISTKQLFHYSQNIRSGDFRQYSYSRSMNLLIYGSTRAPSYNLSNVRAPVALHYSLNDWFVDVRDLERLASELPNVIGKFLVPHPKFNHIDYQWANDVKTLIYDKMLDLMSKY